jgi:hypothetical protein
MSLRTALTVADFSEAERIVFAAEGLLLAHEFCSTAESGLSTEVDKLSIWLRKEIKRRLILRTAAVFLAQNCWPGSSGPRLFGMA